MSVYVCLCVVRPFKYAVKHLTNIIYEDSKCGIIIRAYDTPRNGICFIRNMKQSLSQSAAQPSQTNPNQRCTIATVEQPPYERCCCWCFFIIHIIVIIEMRKASQNMTMANNIDSDDEHQTMNMLFLVCRFELIINVPLKRKTLK